MINLAHALLALLVHSPIPGPPSCQPVDPSQVQSRVSAILALRSPQARAEGTSDLASYWKTRCAVSLWKADPKTVLTLARLLGHAECRLIGSFMLLDVAANLKVAKPAIVSALDAQVRSDKKLFGSAYSTLPAAVLHIASALKCIKSKIDSGVTDPALCADLLRYDLELRKPKISDPGLAA